MLRSLDEFGELSELSESDELTICIGCQVLAKVFGQKFVVHFEDGDSFSIVAGVDFHSCFLWNLNFFGWNSKLWRI